ncbi:sensor histidine kinase [Desulfuromonas versatilis]|uniref:histidine kinase n=1 Tax=Desulfuromonas versatilis TaxID=2802975 RepID=A0ABM8HTJ7_9BACT|nr:sensor histidine kinase [Desulfuromonas versatilis]BCR04352.1 sensor histidine kinase [Desulfuromonas versatilis]
MDSLLVQIDRLLPRNLQVKLSLLVTVLLVVLVALIGALFSDFSANLLREQVGRKALEVAHSVALNPDIRQGLQAGDAAGVQAVAERLRLATGAEYVVVGDRRGIRFSHPDPEKIGLPFVGGDLRPALEEGRSYASQAVGTLGPSLRGIVPIRDQRGEVAGFVAVGYLLSDIHAALRIKQKEILGYVGVVLLFGVLGAAVIARGLKSAIFGLEPREIAALYSERGAIIETIREGIVAVDAGGRLTLVNQAACGYLGQSSAGALRGRSMAEICNGPGLEVALASGERVLDRELDLRGRTMIVNALPLQGGGAVASFRPRDELDLLARELSQMQEYSEIMRAQTHEYSNKLYTIAGLIQIGALPEALELVMTEASGYQELIHTLAWAVPDPIVSGLILGKFNRARELKIALHFDPESSLSDLPAHIDREHLVTILGNLLDNAFEAVRENSDTKEVRLALTDLGEDIILEVEDSGPGIAPQVADSLFEKGVSTRAGAGRGMGLHLVGRALEAIGGQISYGEGELGGALFVVNIPKRRKDPRP